MFGTSDALRTYETKVDHELKERRRHRLWLSTAQQCMMRAELRADHAFPVQLGRPRLTKTPGLTKECHKSFPTVTKDSNTIGAK